jgi:glycosyltransferase involved in cell wall biosynthesis/GT2 family glycosyltransferase
MIRSIFFVTSELAPFTPGGAGVLVAGLRERLQGEGVDVRVLLAADVEVGGPGVIVVSAPAPATARDFWDRSQLVAERLAAEVDDAPPDLVEFHDFDGLAFAALSRRHDLGLERVPIAVRFHGPVDLQVEATGVVPPELVAVREMERSVYAMADVVIAPSAGTRDLILGRYDVPAERVVVGPPELAAPSVVRRTPAAHPELAAVGRLGEVKGSDLLVGAAVRVLDEVPDAVVRFIGGDGWSAQTRQSMRALLETMIPVGERDHIRFEGRIDRDRLPDALATAWGVVVPSRFESFSLAAHEARSLGIPVIVPDIAAFRGLMTEETGALVYDGSQTGLEAAILRFLSDGALRERLAAAPLPALGDPLAPYRGEPPQPRHPQAQAGLATAAMNRWEAIEEQSAGRESALAALARRLLRSLPEPMARLAVRVLPQRLKDRFRNLASWPAEQARRAQRDRRERVERWIGEGRFAERDVPGISIVIPVHDDARYLMDALVSVFDGDAGVVGFEVVVVDDGSTDPATIAAIDAIDWPRVTVIRQENRGLPGARNAGIRAARGAYVVPLDSDDMLGPSYLGAMLRALDAHPDAAFAHCWAHLFGDVERVWQTRPYNPYQLLLSNSVVGCVMMRRSAWEAVGGYDETMTRGNEDWELWVRFLEAGYGQVQLPEPHFHYRKHGTSMSVETEARFEEGRREIAARHPALYGADAMRDLKRRHYPLVSVILADPDTPLEQDLDDHEVVPPARSVADAVRAATGKYVVQWDGVTADRSALADMARGLEDAPRAAAARPRNADGPVLYRRWVLLDAAAEPNGTIEVDVAATGPAGDLARGMAADPLWRSRPSWSVGERGEVPVQRQRPEEEGFLPDWIEQT